MGERVAVMSWGGGVQSTALLLLAVERDQRLLDGLDREAEMFGWDAPSPLPERYFFADVGDEPAALYPHIERMREIADANGTPIEIVRHPSGLTLLEQVEQATRSGTGGMATPPVYVCARDGRYGPVRRTCTRDFKINPLDNAVKAYADGGKLVQWLGISSDESQRMKSGRHGWEFSHPLVWMRWSRGHCAEYLRQHGIEPVRSACVYCPFRRAVEDWRSVMDVPEDRAKIERMDAVLAEHAGSFGGLREPAYLRPMPERVSEWDLSDDGQQSLFDFNDECAGVCGV